MNFKFENGVFLMESMVVSQVTGQVFNAWEPVYSMDDFVDEFGNFHEDMFWQQCGIFMANLIREGVYSPDN